MAIKPDYEAGTVSITNGTTTLAGVNTFWVLAKLQKGDTFKVKNLDAIIEEVVSNSEITLKEAWTGGDLAAAPYAIRYQPDGSRFAGAYVEIRNLLDSGNVSALAGLTGAADKIAYFTGAGAMALADFKAWARSLLSLTPAADQIAYFTGAGTAALADLTTNARTAIGDAASFTSAALALLKLTGTPAADKLPYLTGASGAALADLTAAGRALLDDANASAQLTTLGVSVFVKPFLAAATELTAFQALGGNTGAGWFRLPGGLLCQFGSSIVSVAGGGGGAQITLPTAYTTATSYSKVAMNGESGSGNIMVNEYRTGYPTAAAFYVVLANASGPVPNGTYRINWLTMGS